MSEQDGGLYLVDLQAGLGWLGLLNVMKDRVVDEDEVDSDAAAVDGIAALPPRSTSTKSAS